MSACIDTGGHHTDQVYRFSAERWERKIWSIKGKGGADVPYIRNPTTNNRVKTPLFIIGVDAGKALLYQRLRHETRGRTTVTSRSTRKRAMTSSILSA